MDLQPAILERYGNFSKSNKIVADFLLENWETVAFTTLDKLALQIGVSTTTIIRFARALNLDGYSALQQEVQRSLKTKVSLPQRLDISMEHTQLAQLLTDSFQNDISDLHKTLENISVADVNRSVELIVNAKNVYVLGIRACFSIAHYMAIRLGQVRENVHLLQGIGGIYPEETVSIHPEDVCIAYMFPRYSRVAMNILVLIKKAGAKTIIISSPSHSTLDEYADVVLPCWTHGATIKNSLVAPLCLSQYLVAAVMMSDYPNSKQTLEKIEYALQQGNYFVL